MITSRGDVYKEALGILANASDHIEHTVALIMEKIIPDLKNTDSMLDVGAGIGTMTAHFKHVFREISVVDVNPEIRPELEVQFQHVFIGDFLEYEPEKKFDFVLCSHVLYNLPREKLAAFIEKLRSLVAPGGFCLIELIAPRGENHRFHQSYDPAYSNSAHVFSLLDEAGIRYQNYSMPPNHFRVAKREQMHSLLKFFLFENCPAVKKSLNDTDAAAALDNKIADEVQLTALADESGYDYQQEDDAILLRKSF